MRLERPSLDTACLFEDLTALAWAALTGGGQTMTESDRTSLLRCAIPSYDEGLEPPLTYTDFTGFTRGTFEDLSAPFGKLV